jgi:hypothetical protein
MGRECSTNGEKRNACSLLVGNQKELTAGNLHVIEMEILGEISER